MNQQELENWIEKQIRDGFSTGDIIEALREEGVKEERIRKAEEDLRAELNQEEIDETPDSFAPEEFSSSSETSSKNYKEMQKVSLGSRAIATTFDNLIIGAVSLVPLGIIAFLVGGNFFTGGFLANASFSIRLVSAAIPVTLFLVYFTALEAIYSTTFGKHFFNIRIATLDGQKIGWKESMIRNLLRVIDCQPFPLYIVGFAAAEIEDGKRVGDLAAQTKVVG